MWIQHDRADLRPAAGEFLTTEYTGGGVHERGAMKPAFAVQLLENLLGAFSRIDHTKRLRLSVELLCQLCGGISCVMDMDLISLLHIAGVIHKPVCQFPDSLIHKLSCLPFLFPAGHCRLFRQCLNIADKYISCRFKGFGAVTKPHILCLTACRIIQQGVITVISYNDPVIIFPQ